MLKRNMKSYFSTIKTISCLVKQDFSNFFPCDIWHVLQWVLVVLPELTREMLSHVFCCKFDQDVCKNSWSGKKLNNIKNRGWQQSINCYVNFYCLMLIMLFLWSFTKPLNKLKYRTNIFWKIFYSAIYLKYWLTKIG